MRRGICLLLCAALLAGLLGCGAAREAEAGELLQPVDFYYQAVPDESGLAGGAILPETRDLGPDLLPVEEILALYFQGPVTEGLRSPFPPEVALESASLADGVLTLTFNGAYAALSGVQLTLANACLVYTMEQFTEIEQVCVQTSGSMLTEQLSVPLQAGDFLLEDDSGTNDQAAVKLYFSDSNGRYLVEETRSRTFSSEAEIPAYIVQQLLLGPQESRALAALPEGTSLLDVQVSGGVCTVDFSEEFLLNRPQTSGQARMAVLSVVNSLTERPEIDAVRILCGGQTVESGYFLDLTQALYRDETAIAGQVGTNSSDVSLYVTLEGQEALVPVPVYVRRSASRALELDVLNALVAFQGINGYENPLPSGAMVVDLLTVGSTCRVTFNSAFALCDEDETQANRAVRAVVSTLCALEDIERVQIEIYNGTLTNVDLSQPLTAEADWTLE